MKQTALIIVCVAICAMCIRGQIVQHPPKGSAQRNAIIGALRPVVEKELKQKIIFVINLMNLQGDWVFVDGRPRTLDGKVPSWKNTIYEQNAEEGVQDDNFSALLRRTGRGWKVITHAIGCTDVCYTDWWRRFKAPKAIFPYTD
jgi:hypothetical protein